MPLLSSSADDLTVIQQLHESITFYRTGWKLLIQKLCSVEARITHSEAGTKAGAAQLHIINDNLPATDVLFLCGSEDKGADAEVRRSCEGWQKHVIADTHVSWRTADTEGRAASVALIIVCHGAALRNNVIKICVRRRCTNICIYSEEPSHKRSLLISSGHDFLHFYIFQYKVNYILHVPWVLFLILFKY